MLRSDFESHQLWVKIDEVEEQIDQIGQDHQPEEVADIERIRFQIGYVKSFDVVASTKAAFFHPQMLDDVLATWAQGSNSLNIRIARGVGNPSYLTQAAAEIERGLLQMGPWPRPYGKGGEVKQMTTLFEDLLEAQRLSLLGLEKEHQSLITKVSDLAAEVDAKKNETITSVDEVDAKLRSVEAKIEAQTTLVANAIKSAETEVEALSEKNTESYGKWVSEQEEKFDFEVQSLKTTIQENLESAEEEYEKLISAKEKYTRLVSAIAADEVASQFEQESHWGRRIGLICYGFGFGLIAAAAIPLIWLLSDPALSAEAGQVRWNAILLRVSIGLLAGSAAAIAFRMGGRLVNNANSIKRMELELRAIGPFLANVSEKRQVDKAFIDLVSNAFGKTYIDHSGSKPPEVPENTVSFTSLSQILELIQKVNKFGGPGAGGSSA